MSQGDQNYRSGMSGSGQPDYISDWLAENARLRRWIEEDAPTKDALREEIAQLQADAAELAAQNIRLQEERHTAWEAADYYARDEAYRGEVLARLKKTESVEVEMRRVYALFSAWTEAPTWSGPIFEAFSDAFCALAEAQGWKEGVE